MNYISGMVVKTKVASITEGKSIIHKICKKKNIGTPLNGVYCDGRSPSIVLFELPFLGKSR